MREADFEDIYEQTYRYHTHEELVDLIRFLDGELNEAEGQLSLAESRDATWREAVKTWKRASRRWEELYYDSTDQYSRANRELTDVRQNLEVQEDMSQQLSEQLSDVLYERDQLREVRIERDIWKYAYLEIACDWRKGEFRNERD